MPFDPALVTPTAVGTGTLTFADVDNATFAYTVNGVSQTKAITRQAFGPVPTCTFGVQPTSSLATNYQDLWWAAPAGVGIRLGHQLRAPGQHDLRHLVHLRSRRHAAMAVGHRQQHAGRASMRARCT